jgi:four helix bundle protein
MFLQLAHTRLDVFEVSKMFVLQCYQVTKNFPTEEKFVLVQQIRRAALSVHLNIAEGCSRKSVAERKRFFEVSRGSLIEVDTAFDIACSLNYCTKNELALLGEQLIRTFKLLSGLISSNNSPLTAHHSPEL